MTTKSPTTANLMFAPPSLAQHKTRILEGEVIAPGRFIAVVAQMHPLKRSSEIVVVPGGLSLAEIVERCARQCGVPALASGAVVQIDDHEIPKSLWHRVRPKETAHVSVRAIAGRGIGGILRSVLQIALVAIAGFIVGPAVLGLTGFAATAVSAGLVLGGSLLLGALFPPSSTKAAEAKPQYSIASRRNEAHRWGPIPVLFGRHRIAPKFATSPYTELVGEDQYLHQLFCFGLGPIRIEDIRIGDTPIGEYQDAQVEVREGRPGDAPITLIPSQVIQQDFTIEPMAGRPQTQDAADDAESIALDFSAPQGIGNIGKKDGSISNLTVSFRIDVVNRNTGATAASLPWNLTAKTRDALRRTVRIDVPKSRYFVRVTRLSADDTGDDHLQQVVWTALRSYRNEPPIAHTTPMALVAVRIRASKQLSGAIGDLTAVCTGLRRSWDGQQWIAEAATRSPADAFRDVLQGRAMARPQGNHQLDLPAIENWADRCRLNGWTFDLYKDFESSVPMTLRDICAAGRAVPIMRDGRWSVAMEDEAAPVRELFSPRTVSGFVQSITYSHLPHVLRCKFINERKGWIEDELLVYADGYNRFNATLSQEVEFPGIVNPDLIFRHGRYRLAEMALRGSVYRFNTDGAHLALARGDRVKASHYVVQRAAVQGRVLAVEEQRLTLDTPVTMEQGRTYAIETRRALAVATIVATNAVAAVAGTGNVVTLTGTMPAVGDHFAFGVPTEISGTYKVLRLAPLRGLRADVELVDDAPGIQSADHGPIQHDGGLVIPPPPLATYRPRALRTLEEVITRSSGSVHVLRLFWEMLAPPGKSILSFTAIALSADGAEKRLSVGPDGRSVDFEELQDGEWTFRVFATIEGLGPSNLSDPLTILINVPWGQLGVGLGNIQPDIRYVFEANENNWREAGELQEHLAALTATGLLELEIEADRQNARGIALERDTIDLGARVTREQEVRESGDLAIARDVTRVEGRVDKVSTDQSAQALVISDLGVRVEATETGVRSVAENLSGVVTRVDDPISGLAGLGLAVEVLQSISQANADGVRVAVGRDQLLEARLERAAADAAALAVDEEIERDATYARAFEFDRASAERDAVLAQRTQGVEGRLAATEGRAQAAFQATQSLQGSITAVDERVTVVSEALTGVSARLGDAESKAEAQAQATTSLSGKVSGQGDQLAAQAQSLQVVEARANEATAAALTKVAAIAGPNSSIRFAYQFRLQTAHGYQDAGWYVDLSSNGPATVAFDFARFIITDGTSKAQPFRFEGGAAFLNALVAASAIVGELQAANIRAQMISTDKLAIAGVDASRLAGGAASVVTVMNAGAGAAQGFSTDGGFIEIHGRLNPQGRNDNLSQAITVSIDGVGNVLTIGSISIPNAYRSDGTPQSYAYVPVPSFTVIHLNPGFYTFRLSSAGAATPTAQVIIRNNKR